MTDHFIEQQIAVIEQQIIKLNDAITFLYSNPHKSYTVDSGQTRQQVTRDDLLSLQEQLNILYLRRSTFLAACNGGVVKINPFF